MKSNIYEINFQTCQILHIDCQNSSGLSEVWMKNCKISFSLPVYKKTK